MKIIVEYSSKVQGYFFRDGEAEEWVDNIINFMLNKAEDKDDWELKVSNEMLIHYFRLRVAQGVLKSDQIQFKFNDQIIRVNKFGTLEDWPKGFCDYTDNLLMELLTIGSKSVKKWPKKKG